MLGTIPELDSYYVAGDGLRRDLSCFQMSSSTDLAVRDIFSMYGSSYSTEEIFALAQKLHGENPEVSKNNQTGHDDERVEKAPRPQKSIADDTENPPSTISAVSLPNMYDVSSFIQQIIAPERNVQDDLEVGGTPGPINDHANAMEIELNPLMAAVDFQTKRELLASSLDVSVLPPMHSSWEGQLINLADDGDFYRGRLVYLGIRVGLVMQKKPFPSHIDAVVIAASAGSLKGSWALGALSSVKTVEEESEAIWNDEHRVYIVLPRNCILGPGLTGRVICTAYGVGWVRDGKLKNYTDILLEDDEVLGSEAVKVRSGLVSSLLLATIFLVDKGRQLGLVGWSGVLSILAQYKADQAYASRGATAAILAVRSGEAKYASARDLTASSVPTFWFPLLALAAEISSSNAAWGAVICAVICTMLLFAHSLKLSSYGFHDRFVPSKIFFLAVLAGGSPLSYRIGFYYAYTGIVQCGVTFLERNSGFRMPHAYYFFACMSVANIVETAITAEMYGWDPSPVSTAVRMRWIFGWLCTMAIMYMLGGNNTYESVSKIDEPTSYTLSGWKHRETGSNLASRYIVEYGSGSEVLSEDDPHREDFYTKWSG